MKLLGLLLLAILALPSAQAGLFSGAEPTVTIPFPRAGDSARFEEGGLRQVVYASEDGRGGLRSEPYNVSILMLAEGPAAADDAYGIRRDTFAFRLDALNSTGLMGSIRCHVLVGGDESIRTDILGGGWSSSGSYSMGLGPLDLSSGSYEATLGSGASFAGGPCPQTLPLGGRTLRAGETLTLGEISPGLRGEIANLSSAPSIPTTFHQRDALRFEFDLAKLSDAGASGSMWVVLADGLPVAAEAGYGWGPDAAASAQLVGFEAGQGAPLTPPSGAKVPERDPAGTFQPYGALSFDDEALALPFPFDEAFAAAIGSPNSGLKAFLDERPDAWLETALYAREGLDAGTPVAGSDGSWFFVVTDETDSVMASVDRQSVTAGPLRQPLPPLSAFQPAQPGAATRPRDIEAERPEITEVAASPTLGARIIDAGIDPGKIQSVSYFAAAWDAEPSAWIYLDEASPDASSGSARSAGIDIISGGLAFALTMEQRSERTGLLASPAAGSLEAPERSGLQALSGPLVGAGLAGGAVATGLAALILAVKLLLFPLYTRLTRARLLDNSTRARIYERVRADPGIHRAELVDFAGIGAGATTRHLDQLVRHRFLVQIADGGFTRYYAAGEVPPEVARRAGVLRSGSHQRVYDLFASEPDLSLRAAGERLGISAPAVLKAKRKLEAAGLLPTVPTATVEAGEKPAA